MILRFLTFGLSLFISGLVMACTVTFVPTIWKKNEASSSQLFAFERDGRVGFIDHNGKIVVEPVIEDSIENVGDFFDGLARVGNRGYIDNAGKWVIKGKYLWLEDFSNGMARVTVEDRSQDGGAAAFYIDTTGQSRTPRLPAYSSGNFSEGFAVYEAKGKPAIRGLKPPLYRDFPGLKGFIDPTGTLRVEPAFADLGPFKAGLARAVVDGYCYQKTPDGRAEGTPTTGYPTSCGGAPKDATSPCPVGFVDSTGAFRIKPHFESARDFQEGLAAVSVADKWGFIDPQGDWAIASQFDRVEPFREGLAPVKLGEKWGFIDRAGQITIPARFDTVQPFSESLAMVQSGAALFFIDKRGNVRITGPFLEASSFVHGLAAVRIGENTVRYINRQGRQVFEYYRSRR
jgi:hypothetical protein